MDMVIKRKEDSNIKPAWPSVSFQQNCLSSFPEITQLHDMVLAKNSLPSRVTANIVFLVYTAFVFWTLVSSGTAEADLISNSLRSALREKLLYQ